MPVETDEELREVLGMRRIAVVGASTTPGKAAHEVPAYLQEQGYEVFPVNPFAESVLGVPAADSLEALVETVEVVEVFRPSDEVAGIVESAVGRDDVRVIWTQEGIRDDEAAARAEEAGLTVVQDRCMRTEHRRLVG